jgi:hypothetical protein
MDHDQEIVLELAERGPFIAGSDAVGDACAICGMVEGRDEPLADPGNHATACLRGRATEHHPKTAR